MDIRNMSLREKALQTVVIRVDKDNFNPDKVGAAFFFGEIITDADEMGMEQARKTLRQYIDNADIPILITSDFENGCGSMLKGLTPLPYMMSLGATNSERLAYDYGKATALEARSVGANWTFSPVSDLNINPRNPLVNVRALTDDPDLGVRLLTQVVKGMQENGLAACAKHFPGDGVDYRDQHMVTTHNSLPFEEWKQKHGKVFQALIDSGVYSIMAGHITLPDYQTEIAPNGLPYPATLSKELITDLLKNEMGFEGVVVTDALGMGGFAGFYETKRKALIESFKAGCDMMLWPSPEFVDDLVEAVENGYIPMERLDDAMTRILKMKEKLGLFKGDNHAVDLTAEQKAFVKKTQKDVAEHSITLCKDKSGFFPLSPEKFRTVAVVPVTHHEPALAEAELLARRLRERGFAVDLLRTVHQEEYDAHDLILFALFSRPYRPIGFLDFQGEQAYKIARAVRHGHQKSLAVSFGSPYFGNQYYEKIPAYVNAYSMLSPSVEAFVRAACGDIPFGGFSPVKL